MKALKAGDASRYTISDDDWLLMYVHIPNIICSLKKTGCEVLATEVEMSIT